MSDDMMARSREIAAQPDDIFAVLADPARHRETEPGDWVQASIETDTLTRQGQVFGINMHHEAVGGDYQMWNTVTALDPGRTIAWAPGRRDKNGDIAQGGHIWRYDLEPSGGSTVVTLTYDWSAMPHQAREQVGGMPPFGEAFLDQSLSSLAQAVT